MENNTNSAMPSQAEKNSSRRRRQPAQSSRKVDRGASETPTQNVVMGEEFTKNIPTNSIPPANKLRRDAKMVPASVMKQDLKMATKLNPTAVEFKPSADPVVSIHGEPTTHLATEQMNKRNNRQKGKAQADASNFGIDEQRSRKPQQQRRKNDREPKSGEKQEALSEFKPTNRNEKKRHVKTSAVSNSVVEPAAMEDHLELSCPICTDSAAYFAVGKCNHHVCSLCAVRMRVKSKDTHCAICKEDMSVMIVYKPTTDQHTANPTSENQILRPFNSFGLSAADCDLDNGNIPGVRVDPTAGFLFVDCAKHYSELEALRAMVCPFKNCQARFPTIQTLQKHLKEIHDNNALCTLCVENRPLFISEHTVMNPKQLLCHFKGEEFVAAHGQRAATSENVHTKGHPQCEFCTERFFDSAALYNHMQRQYFTCHLCPRQHMFRYYIDAAALREHHHRDHIVCNICAGIPELFDSDVAIAFRDAREYSDHMRHVHNSHVSSAAGGSNQNKTSFRLGASSTYQTNNPSSVRRDKNGRPRVTVVELEMGTANPYARPEGGSTSHHNANARATVVGRPVDTAAALIPANMRIAGRVTGAGRFAPLDSQDMLMQAAAEEYAAAAEREARGQKKSLKLSQREQAFPALSGSSASAPVVPIKSRVWSSKLGGGSSGSASDLNGSESSTSESPAPVRSVPTPAAELHPLSFLHSSKQQAKDLQKRKDAEAAEKSHQEKLRQEDKRIERNMSLASALLGGNAANKGPGINLTAADVGATLKNRSFVSSLVNPLKHLGWSEVDLMRPIYPPVLVNWARLHQTDLLKIEKKLHNLMTDAQLNSVQLKPMVRGMRMVVHQLSRMYLLNSYEYDPEPSRYVSLVKQVDSYQPTHVLSRAAMLPVHTLPGENGTEIPDLPVVYLTLSSESYSAGLANTNSSISTAGKKATGSHSADYTVRIAFTIAEVVSRINDLLESPELWRAWYQYALEVSAPVRQQPVVFSDEMTDFDLSDAPPLPPPPLPVFVSSPVVKPRALTDLPLPSIVSLVPAGASSVGLRFADRASAQFALHFMNFCVNLHYCSNGINTKMSSRALGGAMPLDAAQLSPKQQQELSVLSVFTLSPAFSVAKLVDLVYITPQSDSRAAGDVPHLPSEAPAATLDRRHFMAAEEAWTTVKSAPKAPAAVVQAVGLSAPKGVPIPIGADGWQFQAVKTKRYDGEDAGAIKAVPFKSAPLQDSWEDLDQFADFNQKKAADEEEMAPERAEEWESFLTEKRSKADQGGVARYQAKRSEPSAAPTADHPSKPSSRYVPPAARDRQDPTTKGCSDNETGASHYDEDDDEGEVFTEEAYALTGEVAEPIEEEEEEYDCCDRTLSVSVGQGATMEPLPAASAPVPAPVFATDYMDSEEAFEEYLRQMQLQHEHESQLPPPPPPHQEQLQRAAGRGAVREVTAEPFNAVIAHVGHGVFNNAPVSAMAVVAIPISEDVSDEEAVREGLRKQVQKDKNASQYNKFGVLDEEDA